MGGLSFWSRVRESITLRLPPVFELVAATPLRGVEFIWVRLPWNPFLKKKDHLIGGLSFLEQGTGVEPASEAWEATIIADILTLRVEVL